MPNDERHCAECGEPMVGPFCAHCGTRSAQVTVGAPAAEAAHDEPTRMRADAQPDSPYRGYADSDDAYDPSGDPTPAASGGPNRTNQMLLALIAVVSIAVVGMLTYLFMHRDARSTAEAPAVSGASSSHAGTSRPSSTSSDASKKGPTQGSSGEANTSAGSGDSQDSGGASNSDAPGGNDASGGSAPDSSATGGSATSDPSPHTTDVGQLDGLVTTTSMGGTTYGMTRHGSELTVWQSGSDGAEKVGSVTLYGGGGNGGLEFLNLPGCTKPVIAWNASGSSGSAAYGFDGSGYQAYVGSAEGSMSPSGGTGSPPNAYGVNPDNGMLEVRDTVDRRDRGQGNHFDRCESASPDVLHMVIGG